MEVLNSWTKLLDSLTKQWYYDANITFRILVKIIHTIAGHNRPQGGDSAHFENHWSKISYDKKAEEDNKYMFTNTRIQQLQALAM